jgi:DNA-binding CsgD family transcriptional regulator/tetratricopeptide (TPR) repeat protein
MSALAEGRGVLVVGERGAGRTYFVQELLARIDPVTRGRIWLGEDVHRLEGSRALRLEAAVAEGRVLPVMTAAARRPLGETLDGLCRDGSVERIVLSPLDPGAMLLAVQNFLGGPLDQEAVPVFVPGRPGGDLVVLQEAVRSAQAAGALVLRGGTWQLVGPVSAQDGLREVIITRLGALTRTTEATGPILEVLSLAPGISLPNIGPLLRGFGEDVIDEELERLEQDCVVDVQIVDEVVRLRVHDPVVELVLPQTIGILRQRRIDDGLASVIGGTPARLLGAGETMALARQALLRGRSVDAALLTRAARDALQAYRPELALQLATAATESGGGFDAEVALAAAESQLGRLPQARERLSAVGARSDLDGVQRQLLVDLGGLVQQRLDDPVARWHLPSGRSTASDGSCGRQSLHRATGQVIVHPASAGAAAYEGASPMDPTPVFEGERLRAAASAAAMRGDLTEARRALDEAEVVLAPVGADLFRVHWTRAFVEGYDRPLPESLEVITRYRDSGAALGHGVHQALCAYLRGAFLLMAGRAGDAEIELRSAMSLYERNDLHVVTAHARPVLATALAIRGEPDAAETELAPALAVERDPYLTGQIREAQAWISVARGNLAAAAETFVQAADAHEADGFDLEALVALIGSARAGSALSVAARVDTLAERVEGACVAVYVRLARALGGVEALGDQVPTGDHALLALELDATGDEAARLGFHGISAESYARASHLHALTGDARAAVSSARRVDAQVAASGLARLPFVEERSGRVLSSRELEIAGLAAAGRSNREIAAALVLSVRTIETHLLRIYRKLGIRDRSRLAAALERVEG